MFNSVTFCFLAMEIIAQILKSTLQGTLHEVFLQSTLTKDIIQLST